VTVAHFIIITPSWRSFKVDKANQITLKTCMDSFRIGLRAMASKQNNARQNLQSFKKLKEMGG
jgi:hypothetical protein